MRVLLLTYGSRGDVEPMVGLAVSLRELGAEVRVCAPPDFAELLDGSGLPLVPLGRSVREMASGAVTGKEPLPAASLPQRAAQMVAATYGSVAAVAEGCDAVVATGLIPAAAAARSVAEKLGIPYVFVACFPTYLPSPHHPPLAWTRPLPPEVTDNRVLWDLNTEDMNALFGEVINGHRVSIGLPPVDNVRDHVFTDQPWLAADPALGPWLQPADLDVVQTGAWIRPDGRPLPADLEAFLDAGAPPVYVGFGSMPMRAAQDVTGPPGWPSWASAHTTARPRPPSPCQPRSGRRWPPRPAPGRGPWPARSAPTGRRWPRGCCSKRSAEKGRRCPREPRGITEPGKVPRAGLRRRRFDPGFSRR
ncbi:glycosyltransferase [Streptosporangium sp. NPDC003464]